jgi:probable addiction module antidote protein
MARKKARVRETFSRYDTADYLKNEDDIAAYIDAVMEEGADDARLIAAALGDVARARGMMQLARDTGLTREGLYKALSADGNPSFDTVLKVMKALGLRLEPRRIVGPPARGSKRRIA